MELRRLGRRRDIDSQDVDDLLLAFALTVLDAATLAAANGLEPFELGTLDAIHLATALALHEQAPLEGFVTYDKQLAAAALGHGLPVLSPKA